MPDRAVKRTEEIPESAGNRVDRRAVLDRLEGEINRVVRELLRSREESARLRMRVVELEEALRKKEEGEEAQILARENRKLKTKLERIESKTREMMKKLEAIREG